MRNSEIPRTGTQVSEIHQSDSPQNKTPISSCACGWAERLVSTHPYELSRQERASLVKHAKTCSACTRSLTEYRALNACLRDLPNHAIQTQEPELEFPPMLERIWQIQDLEEALEKYEHLREKYERREQKEYGTSIIRIGIGWWLAVLISIPLSAIAPSLLIACMDMAKHLQALDVIAFVSLFLLSIPHVAGVLHSKLLRTRKANGKCRMRVQHMTWAQHTKDNNLTDIRR